MWDETKPVWPEGVVTPVVLTFDFDDESYESWFRSARATREPLRVWRLLPGQYSSRVGAPRFLKLLDKHKIKTTWFVPGYDAEMSPEVVKEIVRQGHELGNHNYMHEYNENLEPDEEKEVLRKADSILSKFSGTAVKGYRVTGISSNTYGFLYEMGYIYSSAMLNADNPYIVKMDGKKTDMVELPIMLPLDDSPYYWPTKAARQGFTDREVYELWKEYFDAYYENGYYYMMILHPRVSGTLVRTKYMDRLIQYIKKHKGIWWATCAEVAEWVLKKEKEA